ncbi:MAG: hypothetical protein GF329_01280 [Candidatus Lokiarchaeota archaeon]|nr:hypothetical protein [Candidatus Lokiarchaeota archaeon]
MMSQGNVSNQSIDNSNRFIKVIEVKNPKSFENLINFDIDDELRPCLNNRFDSRYTITAFMVEVNGIIFGHAICFYDIKDNITFFGYFGTYGQNPKLINLLLEKIIKFGETTKSRFIIGPYNLLSGTPSLGFHKQEHEDYIKSFIKSGFSELRKRNLLILLIKHF